MDEVDFEISKVELLNIMADLEVGKNMKQNKLVIEKRIRKWNYKIENITNLGFTERILYVEICHQYYRLKDIYYPN